jgi:hypothetical protein
LSNKIEQPLPAQKNIAPAACQTYRRGEESRSSRSSRIGDERRGVVEVVAVVLVRRGEK